MHVNFIFETHKKTSLDPLLDQLTSKYLDPLLTAKKKNPGSLDFT